jgi:hypothetical protein
MIPLHTVAGRVAGRIVREHALRDDFHAERLLRSECESAGVRSDEAVSQVAALAAELVRASLAPAGVPRWHREAA